MSQLFYRPKRLLRHARRPGVRRRWTALLLCLCMVLGLLPLSARSAGGYAVEFVNYDLSSLTGSYTFANVPEGARLCLLSEVQETRPDYAGESGCTWYLYLEGDADAGYGPAAIPDPPAREGYTFRDWAAQGATDDTLYTVTKDTVFVARYISEGQYVVNLYYQFDNADNTVAAETSTTPYGYGAQISISLPVSDSLAGLTPAIKGSAELNQLLTGTAFAGTLDEDFLKACREAGYVAWDGEARDYLRDENGNVQISIPITYSVAGEVHFTVEYWQQNTEDEEYTLSEMVPGTVTGTTRVSLQELGLVKQYEGFTLTAPSAENAASYTVSAEDTSVIRLYYDRNVHYIYYQMNGGNVVDPVPLRYGQAIPAAVSDESLATRLGYRFDSWLWLGEQGRPIAQPLVMPDHDLTLEANWVGADTTVTLVYWLENANDDSFSVAGQQTITVTSGETVGYRVNAGDFVGTAINEYLTPEGMKGANISDGEYFTFTWADSATQVVANQYGALKTAEGDGSTVINVGYDRKVYTLEFHLGTSGFLGFNIALGDYSTSTDPEDWETGYDWEWVTLFSSPALEIGGERYTLYTNNYRITEKYGAFISDQWPVQDYLSEGGIIGQYLFYGWGAHHESLYAREHPGTESVINGIYSTLSADLIVDSSDPQKVHHLVAYFQTRRHLQQLTYHHMFEAVPETGMAGTAFSGSVYDSYLPLDNVPEGGKDGIQGLSFYEYGDSMTITSDMGASAQNHSQFANVTYQYGCYNGSDVYFFYTYDNYTATYYENNADLSAGTPAQQEIVDFHYVAGMNLAEQLEQKGFDYDYTPSQSYVSSYGNQYNFAGWYTDANLTFPVDWETENPVSNANYYAKWVAPSFTMTLIVPGGTLYSDSLKQFDALGYQYSVSQETDSSTGEVTTTYVVSGIPGGTKASEIVTERHGAQSDYGLAFDYWGYDVNGTEQRYLFDESQLVTGDLVLTARWKTEYTGQYTVRYLTETPQSNGLEPIELDGVTYYRLLEDKVITGVAVGSSVTEEARAVTGYLSSVGALTHVVNAQGGTYFDFIYTPATAQVTYYVHYVRDVGVDYGRAAPPSDVIRLAEDKTVTMGAAALSQSTAVSEVAVMVGGYTPRDSWNTTFILSAEEGQNHFYIYYVSNTYTVSFSATYYFMQDDGTYSAAHTFRLSAQDVLGKTIRAQELVDNYQQYLEDSGDLAQRMEGHTLDTEMTSPLSILLTQKTSTGQGETENVILIYMKNADYTVTYDLNDGGDPTFPAGWENADSFLSKGDGAYTQTVTYPTPANVPATVPSRLSFTFTGWNTAADGSGTAYTAEALGNAPWYHAGGLREDIRLYAQWEGQLVVTFHLREGAWTDTSGQFHNIGTGDTPLWAAYVSSGASVPQPADPSYVQSDGTAYSFVGWTDIHPDDWHFAADDNRIDLAAFEAYRYDFSSPVTEDVDLYAVWDPDVTTFAVSKTDTGTTPLAGAVFALERLQATVSGNPTDGYTYTLVEENGNYATDSSFVTRELTTEADGSLSFENLPAGYYRLTETAAPSGYQGLTQPIILFAPYEGQPSLYEPADSPYVEAAELDGDLQVTVRNIAQYSVTIEAPSELLLTYTPPDFIWNPETLAYEAADSSPGQWTVTSAQGEPQEITVTNTSQGQNSLEVAIALTYLDDYSYLLPLSRLTGGDGFTDGTGAGEVSRSGTLAGASSATFTLSVEGILPVDAALPAAETEAGALTVRVTRPSG